MPLEIWKAGWFVVCSIAAQELRNDACVRFVLTNSGCFCITLLSGNAFFAISVIVSLDCLFFVIMISSCSDK